ncbi:MAG: 2-amino-4-hydroxy-6-hydroxymethyldihydropteridine diphosphokinase [Finegoldia sp.]|nr:2-amino-4-hydroxy-6-hydroxymethyldihydropteridine diphosphokinase [Finegoldia sp.]
MDRLSIKDLEIYANHGLYEAEKELGQKFLLSVDIDYDMKEVATNENLDFSIDYGALAKDLTRIFREKTYDLIETLAYRIIAYIFDSYRIAQEVRVTIKKPWAPINLPLDTAMISIERKKHRVFIGLGSNMGDKNYYLQKAIEKIRDRKIEVLRVSDFYTTKAWGKTDQDDFLNACIEVITYEEPEDLLKILNEIEDELGRERKEKWGSRTIDLDILFIDDKIIYTDKLKVPHPYIRERKFVLEPLNDIAPFFVHPVYKVMIKDLLDDVNKNNRSND